jgi:hypothetical protein
MYWLCLLFTHLKVFRFFSARIFSTGGGTFLLSPVTPNVSFFIKHLLQFLQSVLNPVNPQALFIRDRQLEVAAIPPAVLCVEESECNRCPWRQRACSQVSELHSEPAVLCHGICDVAPAI